MADLYPNLGFDPTPGDLTGYEALAAYARQSAATLEAAVQTLAGVSPDQWRGQAADAFRGHVQSDVLPLVSQAAGSVGRAATALRSWTLTLAALQEEARTLEQQAAPHQATLTAVLQSAGIPSAAQLAFGAKLTPAQQAQYDTATTALTSITIRANQLHDDYLTAVQQTGGHLEDAGNMAPRPPGFFSQLWHDATSSWDDIVHVASDIVHDKAVWEFISGVAGIVATVAGLLALIPPLSVVFAPIALGAAGIALLADVVLAGFDGGSWGAVILDAGAVVGGAAWIKAADKLSELYKASALTSVMSKAPTWAGVASKVPLVTKLPKVGQAITGAEQSVEVAPGLFRMIGASLKAATTGDMKAVDALGPVKEFEQYGTWRGVDILAGQTTWAFSAAGIEAIPGNVRTWVNNLATGKDPWHESADAAAG